MGLDAVCLVGLAGGLACMLRLLVLAMCGLGVSQLGAGIREWTGGVVSLFERALRALSVLIRSVCGVRVIVSTATSGLEVWDTSDFALFRLPAICLVRGSMLSVSLGLVLFRVRIEGADWLGCVCMPDDLLIASLVPPSFFLDSFASGLLGE